MIKSSRTKRRRLQEELQSNDLFEDPYIQNTNETSTFDLHFL